MCGIKYKDCQYRLEYTNVKDDLILWKYLCCNTKKSLVQTLLIKKRFTNTYKFSNYDINKFIIVLRKGVYP